MKKKISIFVFITFLVISLFSCFIYLKKYDDLKFLDKEQKLSLSINNNYIGDKNTNANVIVDNEYPIITLNGKRSIEICPNSNYVEEGYLAYDNYDGDITDKIIVTKSENSILYEVTDSSDNKSVVSRDIIKTDIIKPIIKIKGDNIVTLKLNEKYIEAGFSVSDNCDILLKDDVKITSNVDTSKVGNYTITYSVMDVSGNVASVNRVVKVKKDVDFNTKNKSDYIDSLESYIKEKNYNVSLGYVNLNTGYTYTYNEDVIYYGASLVKTVASLYVYENMELDKELRENVKKSISISDNDAYKFLINKIGLSNLRKYGRDIGAKDFLTRSSDDYFGNTTVSDQIVIWKYLNEFINTNERGNELKKYFANYYADFIYFEGIPHKIHKYGYYNKYFHDVGIVYSDNPYIIVVLTKHGKDDYEKIVSDLSEKIYGLNLIDK